MAHDTRRFARVAQVDDPLTLEAYLKVLEEAGIPTLPLDDESVVGGLTQGFTANLYEVRVPEESLARATELLAAEQARLDADADDAGEAAEREEAEGERH